MVSSAYQSVSVQRERHILQRYPEAPSIVSRSPAQCWKLSVSASDLSERTESCTYQSMPGNFRAGPAASSKKPKPTQASTLMAPGRGRRGLATQTEWHRTLWLPKHCQNLLLNTGGVLRRAHSRSTSLRIGLFR